MDMFRDAQLMSWIAATIAGFITAYLAITNFRQSIEQRRLDLKWKKANAANDLLNELHNNENAALAVHIFDWTSRVVPSADKQRVLVPINETQILHALRSPPSNEQIDDATHDILSAFDWFFYYIDRIENSIMEGFFDFDNVKYIFLPYYIKIDDNRDVFAHFCKSRHYVLAHNFWSRFDADRFWQNTWSSVASGNQNAAHPSAR